MGYPLSLVNRGWDSTVKSIWPECPTESIDETTTWREYLTQPKLKPHLGEDKQDEYVAAYTSSHYEVSKYVWSFLRNNQTIMSIGGNTEQIVREVLAYSQDIRINNVHASGKEKIEQWANERYGLTPEQVKPIYAVAKLRDYGILDVDRNELKEHLGIETEEPQALLKADAEQKLKDFISNHGSLRTLGLVVKDMGTIFLDDDVMASPWEALFDFLVANSIYQEIAEKTEAEKNYQKVLEKDPPIGFKGHEELLQSLIQQLIDPYDNNQDNLRNRSAFLKHVMALEDFKTLKLKRGAAGRVFNIVKDIVENENPRPYS